MAARRIRQKDRSSVSVIEKALWVAVAAACSLAIILGQLSDKQTTSIIGIAVAANLFIVIRMAMQDRAMYVHLSFVVVFSLFHFGLLLAGAIIPELLAGEGSTYRWYFTYRVQTSAAKNAAPING